MTTVDDPTSQTAGPEPQASGRTRPVSDGGPRTIEVKASQIDNAYAVLLAIARHQYGDGTAAGVRQAADADINWPYLSKLASAQAVEPLTYHTLRQTSADLLPPEITSHIDAYQQSLNVRNNFIIQELGRITRLLEAKSVPMLVLKGPVLAQVAYGNVNLRRYVDIDVLIQREDLEVAEEALSDHGYELFDKVSRLGPYRRAVYQYLAQQRAYRRGNGLFNLDLHTRLMPPGMPYTVPFSELWARSASLRFDQGVRAQRLASEDILLILCYHGAKNQWSSLKHVFDIAALIASVDLQWDVIAQRAKRVHAERILGLGLLMAHKMVGCAVPQALIAAPRVPEALGEAASRLEVRLRRRQSGRSMPLSYAERVKLYLLLQDTWANKLRYMLFSAARNVWDTWIK